MLSGCKFALHTVPDLHSSTFWVDSAEIELPVKMEETGVSVAVEVVLKQEVHQQDETKVPGTYSYFGSGFTAAGFAADTRESKRTVRDILLESSDLAFPAEMPTHYTKSYRACKRKMHHVDENGHYPRDVRHLKIGRNRNTIHFA